MEQKLKQDWQLGDNLRRLRTDHGYSQEKLCTQLLLLNCDIGRSTYSKYESGELNIRTSVLVRLQKLYNCAYEEFFRDLEKNNTSLSGKNAEESKSR